MTRERFKERFQTFSNHELLRIIERASDYDPDALEAANAVMEGRNLSETEWAEAKNAWQAEQTQRQEQEEKRAVFEKKVKGLGASIFEAINPIQESAPSVIKQIRWITLVFGLIAIFRFYREFGLISHMLDDHFSWKLEIIAYVLPLVLLPVAVFLFAQEKKVGWVLMASSLSYSMITCMVLSVRAWNRESSGASPLDHLFPQAFFVATMGITLFFAGALWVLTRKEIRAHFDISVRLAIGALLVLPVLQGLYILTLLMQGA